MKVIVGVVPGDVGALVALHGNLYWKEYRYDRRFEAYVAAGMAEMVLRYDAARDCLLIVKEKGQIIGSIAIVHQGRDRAQLRWFLVAPAFRRKGLGKHLMKAALRFARSAGYRSVFLWTTSELDAARHVYEGAGFRRTVRRTHDLWGRRKMTEERYMLDLR
jgi:GNAT superfamily N-acetyltransferase